MANDRVDKQWQTAGLEKYSNQAILGTLGHYGVSVEENGFLSLAKERYPLAIAEGWLQSWKGTGQFARFPLAAAEELWKRTQGDRLAPADFASAMIGLVQALVGYVEKGLQSLDKHFQEVSSLKARAPLNNGLLDRDFAVEVELRMGEFVSVFNDMVEKLFRKGKLQEALAVAEIEEFVFPERRGVVKALMPSYEGKTDQSIAELAALLKETNRDDEAQLTVLDALISLEAYDQVLAPLNEMLKRAEAAKDYHLALAVGDRLLHVTEVVQGSESDEVLALQERLTAVAEEHEAAHPDH